MKVSRFNMLCTGVPRSQETVPIRNKPFLRGELRKEACVLHAFLDIEETRRALPRGLSINLRNKAGAVSPNTKAFDPQIACPPPGKKCWHIFGIQKRNKNEFTQDVWASPAQQTLAEGATGVPRL